MKPFLTTAFFIVLTMYFNACSSTKSAQDSKSITNESTATTIFTNPSEQQVIINTTLGDITIKLYNETPLHRDAFIANVKDGTYNELLFHRVIKGFMIQGGDPLSRNAKPDQMLGMGSKHTPPQRIPAEFNANLIHKKGALCAARDNNPEKASSDCQFYIVQGKIANDNELTQMETRNDIKYTEEQRTVYKTIGGTPFLDNNYTVYGEVVKGLEVLDAIANTPTKSGDRPVTDVKFSMKLID